MVTLGQVTDVELRSASRVAGARFPVWGTTALVLVTDPAAVRDAEATLRAELDGAAAVWFGDSAGIARVNAGAGAETRVSADLARVLDVALRAAFDTDGLVDPTVGAQNGDGPASGGWWRVSWDHRRRTVLLPPGLALDVSATGKALAADDAAARLATELGQGVLVGVGTDVAVAGEAPPGGWRLRLGEERVRPASRLERAVRLTTGGLATCATSNRHWRRTSQPSQALLSRSTRPDAANPVTGEPAEQHWRTVSVAAGSCVEANTASVAALLLGPAAPGWLARRGLAARLVARDGELITIGEGWADT